MNSLRWAWPLFILQHLIHSQALGCRLVTSPQRSGIYSRQKNGSVQCSTAELLTVLVSSFVIWSLHFYISLCLFSFHRSSSYTEHLHRRNTNNNKNTSTSVLVNQPNSMRFSGKICYNIIVYNNIFSTSYGKA